MQTLQTVLACHIEWAGLQSTKMKKNVGKQEIELIQNITTQKSESREHPPNHCSCFVLSSRRRIRQAMKSSNRSDEEKLIRHFLDHSLWSVHNCSSDAPPTVPQHIFDTPFLKYLHPSRLCFQLTDINCDEHYFQAAFSAEDELVTEWLADKCEGFYDPPLEHMVTLGKAIEEDGHTPSDMASLIDGYRFRQILEDIDSRRRKMQDMECTSVSIILDEILPRFRRLLQSTTIMDIRDRSTQRSSNLEVDPMTNTIMTRVKIWIYQELFLLRQELWVCMVFKDVEERLKWYSSREKAIWLKCWCWEGMDRQLADLIDDVIDGERLLPIPPRKAVE
jgi:hypothetical protein